MAEKYVRADVSSRKGGAVTPYQRPLQSVLGIVQPEVHSNKRALQMDAANKLVRGAISAYGVWEDHQRANKADSDQQREILLETYKRAIQREGADAISNPEKLQQFNSRFLSALKEGEIANIPYNADIDDDQLRAKMGFIAEDFVSQNNVGKVSQIQPVSALAQESFYRKDKGIVKVLEGSHLAKSLGTTNFEDTDKAPILNVNPEVLNGVAREATLTSLAYSAVSTGREEDFVDSLSGIFNRGEISADEYGKAMQQFVKLNNLKVQAANRAEEERDAKTEEYMLKETGKTAALLNLGGPDVNLTPTQLSALVKQREQTSETYTNAVIQDRNLGVSNAATLSQATRLVKMGIISPEDFGAIQRTMSVSAAAINGSVKGFSSISSDKFFQGLQQEFAPRVSSAFALHRDEVAQAMIKLKYVETRDQANAILTNENGGLIGAHYAIKEHLPITAEELAKVITTGTPDELRKRISEAEVKLSKAQKDEPNKVREQKLFQDLTVLRGLQQYYGGPLPRDITKSPSGTKRGPAATGDDDREVAFIRDFISPIFEFFSGD